MWHYVTYETYFKDEFKMILQIDINVQHISLHF